MNNTNQAHVIVCLLPFQYSQWVPTGHQIIDDRIGQYYIDKEEQLDEIVAGRHLIGVKIGNPKRYSRQQIFELHRELNNIYKNIDKSNSQLHLQVAEKYFDDKSVESLRWIEQGINKEDTLKYLMDGYIEHLNAHERSQLIPSIPVEDFEAFEWQKSENSIHQIRIVIYDEIETIFPFILAAGHHSRILFIKMNPHEKEQSILSRAGVEIHYDEMLSGAIFDLIHYGLQYRIPPLLIVKGKVINRLTTYGERLNMDGRPYLLQTPHFDLFAAVHRPGQLNLTADLYQQIMDYYRQPFTVMEYHVEIPLYYEVEMLKEWL